MMQPWFLGVMAIVASVFVSAGIIRVLRRAHQVGAAHTGSALIIRRAMAVGLAAGLLAAVIFGIAQVRSDSGSSPFYLRFLDQGPPDVFGFSQVFAPLIGTVAAVLVVVFTRPAQGRQLSVRTTDLSQRRQKLLSFANLLPVTVALVLLVLVIVALWTTMVGESGSTFAWSLDVTQGGTTNEAEGFDGWFTTAAITASVLVAALAVPALVLLERSPGRGNDATQHEDALHRDTLARAVVAITITGLCMAMGSLLWHAGATTWTESFFPIVGDCHSTGPGSSMCRQVGMNYAQPAHLIGLIEIIAGIETFGLATLILLRLARDPA
ncbi:hypothetical protein AX769_21030 (plasmid) [Frondihabitans sp. PAMC 28766]|uniref:hypothetical protein n=1 Tax=Frondihabitans sp. PAMC 28766 TaxID=1795630 RepID=UPI00078BED65|nr:hypothetical protein [Frondihabitans sp. PAMC 28766]AMM22628.1 hypothetical protein AX769_21030 [Frondihabitans sp. PAMC 28766]